MTITEDELKALLKRRQEHADLDYKRDIVLDSEGDKAAFVKDVLSLANSADIGYIVTGVEDQTWAPVGISNSHRPERLYEVMRGKSDPPVTIEYTELSIGNHEHGVVKVYGENPPYVVAVRDSFGGRLTGSKSQVRIFRGSIFVRNINVNDGIARARLDRLYHRAQITLKLRARVHPGNPKLVIVDSSAENRGRSAARSLQMLLRFTGALNVLTGAGGWEDVSRVNDNVPTVYVDVPVLHPGLPLVIGEVQVQFPEVKHELELQYQIRGENLLPEDDEATLEIHDAS